jgi:hypothetical protein
MPTAVRPKRASTANIIELNDEPMTTGKTMKHWVIAAVAIASVGACAIGASAAAAAPIDGFAAFFKTFAAAIAKDDQQALAGMVVLGPGLDDNDTPLTFAKFHHAALGPAARRCLAKGGAVRNDNGDGTADYAVTCGHTIYVFSKTKAGWRLTDLSPDD